MKLNKKMVAINVLATFLIAETAMARIQGVRTSGTSGSSGSSSGTNETVKTTPATKEDIEVTISNTEEKCSSDMDMATSFPQALFSEISRDGRGLDISVKGDKVFIKMPPIVNVCGEFKPELKQNDATKNVAIYMKLVGKKDGKDVQLTYKEFEECLVKEKIMVDGKIDHGSHPLKFYTGATYSTQFKFDRKKDVKKTATVSFAHPNEYDDETLGYGAVYGYDDRAGSAVGACTRAELVSDKILYINQGEEAIIAIINEICEKGTAQEIAEASKTWGNADALKDISDKVLAEMQAGYLIKARKEVEDKYKKMSVIGDQLGKELETMDEATAKKKVKDYEHLVTEVDDMLITPSIARLDFLMNERSKLEEDTPRVKTIDEEIKILNQDISKYSKEDAGGKSNLYHTMKRFALTDSAEVIDSIQQKSRFYGQIYAGSEDTRGQKLSFSQAEKLHGRELAKFMKKAKGDWSDFYRARKGDKYPIQKAVRERERAEKRLQTRIANFDKSEAKGYQSACRVTMFGTYANPKKCRTFQEGAQKRYKQAYSRMQKDYSVVTKNDSKIAEMSGYYEEYAKTQEARDLASAEEGDGEWSEFDSLMFDETESEFAMREGNPNAYDPRYYQMQNQGMPNQMQMQMQNPFSGQGQQQMMPQQGGWPSL